MGEDRQRMLDLIAAYARSHGYSAVVDASLAAYFTSAIDITSDVKASLSRNAAK
jgi:Skp family chaperone for outer membrane proteins